jgi:hypothetical protein
MVDILALSKAELEDLFQEQGIRVPAGKRIGAELAAVNAVQKVVRKKLAEANRMLAEASFPSQQWEMGLELLQAGLTVEGTYDDELTQQLIAALESASGRRAAWQAEHRELQVRRNRRYGSSLTGSASERN